MSDRFAKTTAALRYWLLGQGYYRALDALEYGRELHTGLRKDGRTPEFQHQVDIANYVRCLPNLIHPEDSIVTAILHDTGEDKSRQVSLNQLIDRFGPTAGNAIVRVTKKTHETVRDEDELYADMEQCPIASIIKGADRMHNQGSMPGVFEAQKMERTMLFTEERILPMLKNARRRFPQQEAAYELIKVSLVTQNAMVRAMSNDDNNPDKPSELGLSL